MIEVRQLVPNIYNPQVHEAAAGPGAVIFRSRHQLRSETCLLMTRLDGKKAEVSAIRSQLNPDTAHQDSIFRQQEFSGLKQIPDGLEVDPVAVDQE